MTAQPPPVPSANEEGTKSATAPNREHRGFAAQELRLLSVAVVLLGLGLFFAVPFVLSIGSVVFLPLTAALILTIILSPLADRLAGLGLPNPLASLSALLVFFGVLILALALILQPAVALFDRLPELLDTAGRRFADLRERFAWIGRIQ